MIFSVLWRVRKKCSHACGNKIFSALGVTYVFVAFRDLSAGTKFGLRKSRVMLLLKSRLESDTGGKKQTLPS